MKQLEQRTVNTLLAALRLYQRTPPAEIPNEIIELAHPVDGPPALDAREIGALCEAINCEADSGDGAFSGIEGFLGTDLASGTDTTCYVVAKGNAFDGLTLFGPFASPDAVNAWVGDDGKLDDDWVAVELEPVEPTP